MSLRFCYENLMESASSVTPSSEDSDYPVENCYDWLASDYFKPASVASDVTITVTLGSSDSANYFAFYAHDLHTQGASIKLEYNDGSWNDAFTAFSPTDGDPHIIFFDSQSASSWRITISGASDIFSLGVVAFGAYMETERGIWNGFSPPKLARNPVIGTSVSDSGVFVGRSVISEGFETSLNVEFAGIAWMRSDWLPFVQHAETKPFFLAWDYTNYSTEFAFCWTSGPIGKAVHTHHGLMAATLQLRGIAAG